MFFLKIILKIMTIFKKLIFRTKKLILDCLLEGNVTFAKIITLSTTSTSATWSPLQITNSGAVLTWDVTGDITLTSQNVNDPTFNLSANLGTVYMDVYDVSGVKILQFPSLNINSLNIDNAVNLEQLVFNSNQLTSLNLTYNTKLFNIALSSNSLTSLDISNNPLLTTINCGNNLLTSLNISGNSSLTNINCYLNNIPNLDLSSNINLTQVTVMMNNMIPSATDQIYIDLANGTGINGSLYIRNNRTTASDIARATLVSRGWTFDEGYTT